MAEPAWDYDKEPESLNEAVFIALGGASACWDNLIGAGIFESERAKEIGERLTQWINENYEPKEHACA